MFQIVPARSYYISSVNFCVMPYTAQESNIVHVSSNKDSELHVEHDTSVNLDVKNSNILVVDDDIDILEGYEYIFECEGLNIDIALTPSEALNKAREKKFKLAILDYKLPNMNGDKLAEELMKIDSSIKLIFISGFKEGIDSMLGNGINVGGFFFKPIDPVSLINTARSIINDQPF